MRHIVAAALRFRFLVIAMALGIMALGAVELRKMPVDVFPEFSPPKVEIQTLAVGLAPDEVENLISVPLEQVLAGTPGLDVIRSKSVNDLSQIELIFKRGTDQQRNRQLTQERMDQVAPHLPTWAAPPVMLQPLSATSRAMKIGITSKSLTGIQQSMIAYWTIRQRLLRVEGVANVPIWGERLEMLNVNVDPARMALRGDDLETDMTTTSDALESGLMRFSGGAVIGTGGFVEANGVRTGIRHKLPIASAEDLAKVVVRPATAGAPAIRLADVATVNVDHQPMVGDAVIANKGGGAAGPGLMLIVEKLPWANTLDVTRGVEEAIAALQPGLPDLEIDTTIFRPATFIETSLDNLSHALLLGCLLLIAMLFLFLYEWRVALISAITIPLSLTAAILVLGWRGTTINTMILAGFAIALGDIVDDAIIDIENVVRRLREHRAAGASGSVAGVVLRASVEVRSAIVVATVIEVVAIVPVLFLDGLSGAFFRPLVLSYALALLASMVVAMTVTPALALLAMQKRGFKRQQAPPLARRLQGGYTRMMRPMLTTTKPAALISAVAIATGIAIAPGLGQSLLPEFKERDFLMHFLTKPGTSLQEEVRITTASAKDLQAIPGVQNFGAHIGQAFQSDEPVGPEFGENWISIDRKADYDETLKTVTATIDGYPGLIRDTQTYLKERIREVLAGTSYPIVVRIYGSDGTVLRAKAKEIYEALKTIPGTTSLKAEPQAEVPQIQVKVDLDKAQQVGLKPGDVRRLSSAQIQGEEVGDIFRDGKAYDVNVWTVANRRSTVEDIANLRIDAPYGGTVRLADVAEVKVGSALNYVKHENIARKIDVTADVAPGRDLGSVVREVEKRLATIALPAGYHYKMLGDFQERKAANKKLQSLGILAAIVIFFLLQASFNSFRLAALAWCTIWFALVGGVVAVKLGDGVVSLGAMVGFLAVIGIVARHKIMLITHLQHLERVEGMAFGPELVLRGAKERLVPITMTALATGLALLPLVVTGSIPGQEVEHPMAVVILGGLIAATVTNLFVIPPLYLAMETRRRNREARKGQLAEVSAG